ncbi:glycerol-3-phosphate 1-O-acyltransferase PlsY [Holophaga foetida]|uniref:glycerol-3-phosphate 1-O-acyltransferase PlsY n=1 Tax=Holophaga foetida TaxID=35839 RepID=UPI0002475067|nr:glycerol-3-phosphate 1-O-acyltransferase PlsY [Holophaga foetida]
MYTLNLQSFIAWCLGAFLAGSIPFGLILVKLAGKGDVRQQGSGNIGATNVMRAGGKALGIVTLLLDVAKGFLPVFLARKVGVSMVALSWIALFAVLGHVFTPWLRFKGGKGVATALGACLAYHALLPLPALGSFFVVVAISGYVSLGSAVAALVLIPTALGLFGPRFSGIVALPEATARYLILAWVLMPALVVRKHAGNIQRLIDGTENRLWGKKKEGRS